MNIPFLAKSRRKHALEAVSPPALTAEPRAWVQYVIVRWMHYLDMHVVEVVHACIRVYMFCTFFAVAVLVGKVPSLALPCSQSLVSHLFDPLLHFLHSSSNERQRDSHAGRAADEGKGQSLRTTQEGSSSDGNNLVNGRSSSTLRIRARSAI